MKSFKRQAFYSGKKLIRFILGGTITLCILVALFLVVWKLPQRQSSILKKRIEAEEKTSVKREKLFELENKIRENYLKVIQSFGGLGFILTSYFAWKNLQAAEKNRELAEKTAETTRRLTVDKQITERISKAVELVSESEKPDARIGGIFLLERIALDSPKDKLTIIQFLTNYIRRFQKIDQDKKADKERFTAKNIPSDIQVALAVIGCINDKNFQGRGTDLSSSDLKGAYLIQADLSKIDFNHSYLDFADLCEANLEKAILIRANLVSTDLIGSNLRAAKLSYANLKNACLNNADLTNADLSQSTLTSVTFMNTTLTNAILQDTELNEADFNGARLNGADLTRANLRYANLVNSNLSLAVFRGADLEGADLEGADLEGADFREVKKIPDDDTLIKTYNWDKAKYNMGVLERLQLLKSEGLV